MLFFRSIGLFAIPVACLLWPEQASCDPVFTERIVMIEDTSKDQGEWRTTYYRDSTIKRKSYYKNGKLEGWAFDYYPSGKLERQIFFYEGDCAGRWITWYETGEIKSLRFCKIPGGRDWGPRIEWYDNGYIQSIKYPMGGREVYFHFNGIPKTVKDVQFYVSSGLEIHWLANGQMISARKFLDREPVDDIPADEAQKIYDFYAKLNKKKTGGEISLEKGRFFIPYPNGNGHVIDMRIKDGLLNGKVTSHNHDGQLLSRVSMDREQVDGECLLMSPAGDTMNYGRFNNMEQEVWITYHPNGVRRYYHEYDKGNKFPSIDRKYYDNGILKESYEVSHNGLGIRRSYYRSGKKESYGEFRDLRRTDPEFRWGHRKMCNKTIKWYENGQMEWVLDYSDTDSTQRTRKITFFENGDTSRYEELNGTQRHGRYAEWYETGGLKIEGRYSQGKQHGNWKQYEEGEAIAEDKHFQKGRLIKKPPAEQCFCDTFISPPGFVNMLKSIVDSATIERYNNGAFASVSELASHLFYFGYHGGHSATLISFQPMDIWFSNTSMIRLRLNPCRHTNSVSHLHAETANIRNSGYPFRLWLYPETIEISFNPNHYLPVAAEPHRPKVKKEENRVKFLFSVDRLTYNLESLQLENVQMTCFTDFQIPGAGMEVRGVNRAIPILMPGSGDNWNDAMDMLNRSESGPLRDSIFDQAKLEKRRSMYIRGGEITFTNDAKTYTGKLMLGVMFSAGFTACMKFDRKKTAKEIVPLLKEQKLRSVRYASQKGSHYVYFTYGLGL